MSKKRDEEQYTQPELRQKIKEELMQSDKGGKKGQWSARKSQLLAKEYEDQGGGYKHEKDEQAKALDQWTKEDWQTQDGEANARKKGKTSRYLPKAVWDKLSPAEQQEAEQTKAQGSKKGEQQVAYTPAVKKALQQVKKEEKKPTKKDLLAEAKKLDIKGRSKMNTAALEKAIKDHK